MEKLQRNLGLTNKKGPNTLFFTAGILLLLRLFTIRLTTDWGEIQGEAEQKRVPPPLGVKRLDRFGYIELESARGDLFDVSIAFLEFPSQT
jgi:hypothetical protein